MIIKNCLHCQKEFKRYLSDIKNGGGKYCSHSCSSKNTLNAKGHKLSKIAKLKISKANKGKLINENNPMWKGDKVGKTALHAWVKRRLGKPDTCQKCGKSGLLDQFINWANISGKYKRSLTDWIRLCVWCHLKYDGTGFKKGVGPIVHKISCSCFRCIGRRKDVMSTLSQGKSAL